MDLRPVTREDLPALEAIVRQPSVRCWGWTDLDDTGATRFVIEFGGEIAGMVQYSEEDDPDYRSASIDIFLSEPFRGRGLGVEAVRRVAELLFAERGHHRVTIDPAAANDRAIRAYEKAGFRAVGRLEAAWRDPEGEWRDLVLMEWVRRG